MGEIEQLQKEINTLRQEKTLCQKNLKGINGEINKADEEISHLVNEIESSQNTSKMNQNMMLNLKMKNEEDKSNYYRRLNELNKELKDPRLTKASRLKTEMNAIQNDTATILKHRLTKLIINNREKVKLIDNYQRNMKVIDEAFNTIKEATGLTEIEEIQDTFIKGEEQNYNLITYVDVLNQEIDSIVDSNHTMKIKTEALRMEHAEKKRILAGTPDDEKRSRQVEEYIQSKKKEVKEFQTMLNEVQPDVKEVLTRLANSKFNRQNPHKIQEYQSSGVILNDANLGEYLSELEDYTNKILIYKGRAKNQENEEIFAKALLLEELSPKEFKKKVYVSIHLCRIIARCTECWRTTGRRGRASKGCWIGSSWRKWRGGIWRGRRRKQRGGRNEWMVYIWHYDNDE